MNTMTPQTSFPVLSHCVIQKAKQKKNCMNIFYAYYAGSQIYGSKLTYAWRYENDP